MKMMDAPGLSPGQWLDDIPWDDSGASSLARPQSMWFQGSMPVEAFTGAAAASAQSASYDQAPNPQLPAFSSSRLTAPPRGGHVSNLHLHPEMSTLARAQQEIGVHAAPAPPQLRHQLYALAPVEQDNSVTNMYATQSSHNIIGAAGGQQALSRDQPISIVEHWPQSSLIFVGEQNFLSQNQQQRAQGVIPQHPPVMEQVSLPFAPELNAQPATEGCSMFVTTRVTQEDEAHSHEGSTQASDEIGAAIGSALPSGL